jgi:hypothetical protein
MTSNGLNIEGTIPSDISTPSENAAGTKGSTAPKGSTQSEDAPDIKNYILESDQSTSNLNNLSTLGESKVSSNDCGLLVIKKVNASGFEKDPLDYHPPFDAVDGDSSTWWSNQAKKSWLDIDLGQESLLCGISVQWHKGDIRKYSFEISISPDGNEFKKVFKGTNKIGSLNEETYSFGPTAERHVMLTITTTSSAKGWASINEINAS